jgi:hypothetical protein
MNSISDIVEIVNNERTAVFCGAGISYNSGIPTVDQLIPEMLETLKIKKSDKAKLYGTDGRLIMPFEPFIQTISSCCDIEKILDIYKLGEPNANHILLAN